MKKKFSIFIFCIFLYYIYSQTSEPILRINTDMHTASIKRIDSSFSGKLILTVSEDKTARLWNSINGELIKILRPPIDDGDEGKLLTGALSPDGKFAAVSGITGYKWNKNISIYIFNVDTGEIIKIIKGLNNIVRDMEFSKKGDYLACCLSQGYGIKIYTTKDWSLYKEIEIKDKDVYCCSFDINGRLATVSFDGYLRLFNNNFDLITQTFLSAGKFPSSVSFNTGGSKIVVGYNDVSKIQVFNGYDLSLIYEPMINDISLNQKFEVVSWSFDDNFLFSGGTYQKISDNSPWFQIRKWKNAGQGSFEDFPSSLNSIMDLKSLPDNSIIFCSNQPDFGKLKINGEKIFYKKSDNLSFRNYHYNYFKVNENGSEITIKPEEKDFLTFSIKDRLLSKKDTNNKLAVANTNNIKISNWQDSYNIFLNGSELNILKKNERCRCVAISQNENFIVIGANWNLYCIDKNGNKIWSINSSSTVWSVNISSNNQTVISCYGDGTIKWHNLNTGKELLSLFISGDAKKWVIWSPQGYYDCSPGGEDLIGWHINNGSDKKADFFPFSSFSQKFYRPDIIASIINFYDENKAITEANSKRDIVEEKKTITELLPPVVTIISPKNNYEVNTDIISIKINIRTPNNDPVTEVKTQLNGRPLNQSGTKGVKIVSKTGDDRDITVPLKDGENIISVYAKNSSGFSEPATITVVKKSNISSSSENLNKSSRPNLYIVAAGISEYNDPDLKLKYPVKDINDFITEISKQKNKLYNDIKIKVYLDKEATKNNILEGFEWLENTTTNEDVAMIYISGHGINDSSGNLYYVTIDTNIEKLRTTGLPSDEINRTISQIKGNIIYFMDTCHSGNINFIRRYNPNIDFTGAINKFRKPENGAVVFCSSSGKQTSLESDEWQNGAFTKALIEGLSGKADFFKDGVITVKSLDLYISKRVTELTKEQQTPITISPDAVKDFKIAVLK